MTWVKLDDAIWSHRKLRAAGPEPAWLYVCGLAWCNQNLSDGRIPRHVVGMLTDVRRPDQAAARLVEVGLWHDTDDGWEVHDYLDYQPSKSHVESQRDAARDRKRKSRQSSQRDADGTDGVSPLPPSRPVPTPSSSSSSATSSNAPDDDDDLLEAVARLRLEARVREIGPVSSPRGWLTAAVGRLRSELNGQVGQARERFDFATTDELARFLFDGTEPRRHRCPYCGTEGLNAEEFRSSHGEACELVNEGSGP